MFDWTKKNDTLTPWWWVEKRVRAGLSLYTNAWRNMRKGEECLSNWLNDNFLTCNRFPVFRNFLPVWIQRLIPIVLHLTWLEIWNAFYCLNYLLILNQLVVTFCKYELMAFPLDLFRNNNKILLPPKRYNIILQEQQSMLMMGDVERRGAPKCGFSAVSA